MSRIAFVSFFALCVIWCRSEAFAQAPAIEWQRTYGTNYTEEARIVKPLAAGGYMAGGTMDGNFWIARLSDDGAPIWEKKLGGRLAEELHDLQLTPDGGCIVAGRSFSIDGDVTDHIGPDYNSDMWVVKLDADGNVQWKKSYGGLEDDFAYAIETTRDGGYILAGFTASRQLTGYHGANFGTFDYLIIKIAANGDQQWHRCYGGSSNDQAMAIRQTPDGGYIVNGAAQSSDGDVDPADHFSHNYDYWVLKLSATGDIQWQRSLGGYYDDWGQSLELTTDGGYVLGGRSASNDGDVSGNHVGFFANFDYWIVRLNATGQVLWQKCFGGVELEDSWSVVQTADEGFIIAGIAWSNDGDVGPGSGSRPDAWILKINSTGVIQWRKTLGGPGWDGANYIQPTPDNGYIVAGYAGAIGGDITNYHGGYGDAWIIKLKGEPCTPKIDISGPLSGLCKNGVADFSSTIFNGGYNPGYQWLINGQPAGTNSPTFSVSSLSDNDSITCLLTSDAVCATVATVISDTFVVTIIPSLTPSISISSDRTSICPGEGITITANISGAGEHPTLQWLKNGVVTGDQQSSVITSSLNNGDIISCRVIADPAYACYTATDALSNNLAITVKNVTTPVLTLTADKQSICSQEKVVFSASVANGENGHYNWMLNGASISTDTRSYQSNELKQGDEVFVVYTGTSNGCPVPPVSSNMISMIVHPLPVITVSLKDTLISAGAQVNIAATITGVGTTFSWSPAHLITSPNSLLTTTVPLSTNQRITLKASSSQGCSSSEVISIRVQYPLLMPTAFTPNNDGVNDVFRIPQNAVIELKHFSIFNRWGEVVFTTKDKTKGWDGRVRGVPAESTAYVFIVEGETEKGPVSIKGSFLLIR